MNLLLASLTFDVRSNLNPIPEIYRESKKGRPNWTAPLFRKSLAAEPGLRRLVVESVRRGFVRLEHRVTVRQQLAQVVAAERPFDVGDRVEVVQQGVDTLG